MNYNEFKTAMDLQFGKLTITSDVSERLSRLGFSANDLKEAIAKHKSDCSGNPSVYVGTYRKYNIGSLSGLWIDLSSFDSFQQFIAFCQAIHADEENPELMAQDFEGFPNIYYNEGFLSESDFYNIKHYIEICDQYEKDAVDDFFNLGFDDLDSFEESYCGQWDSPEDFARHLADECYDIDNRFGDLAMYFDYGAFARDLFFDYTMGDNGSVFRRV